MRGAIRTIVTLVVATSIHLFGGDQSQHSQISDEQIETDFNSSTSVEECIQIDSVFEITYYYGEYGSIAGEIYFLHDNKKAALRGPHPFNLYKGYSYSFVLVPLGRSKDTYEIKVIAEGDKCTTKTRPRTRESLFPPESPHLDETTIPKPWPQFFAGLFSSYL